jgi:ribosomal protein S18 acetylase RimI-like enzyme
VPTHSHVDGNGVTIEEYDGPRRDLLWSFREAEDSETLLAGYLGLGRVWIATAADGEVLGHLQAVPVDDEVTWEVTNTAVVEAVRGRGVGRRLLEHAVAEAARAGVARVVLATAAADVGNLRFYQRCGFRMTHVVHDAFGPANGYPDDIVVDGIPMRDQVWFELRL